MLLMLLAPHPQQSSVALALEILDPILVFFMGLIAAVVGWALNKVYSNITADIRRIERLAVMNTSRMNMWEASGHIVRTPFYTDEGEERSDG